MDIEVEELKSMVDHHEHFVLIDVREPYEYEEFNLGGTLIPLGELFSLPDKVAEDKNVEIIVYCRTGNRSAMAQRILQQSGYTKVRNLIGGIVAWQAKGY
ncbi:MAG: rhodanese-like domain-containing protein [Saprospiraceae bacterium]|nr:rhodanese-like domain-containing protein [Saprospiraceae bacterium]